MAPRVLKLGTRRSALARAQSGAIAQLLQQQHPGLTVELVGIETRGDRILDRPLSAVEGKEFFTAEIDQALLAGDVDLTVHSFKDLSLERSSRLQLAAVPQREPPFDIALFAPDVPARLAAGEPLRVGSSSPRRATFVPEFLQRTLPSPGAASAAGMAGTAPRVQLVELRGNVDSRLRRLHEPRGSERHLDGIVLAFAGLARLWADRAGQVLLRELLSPLPRMVLPLSACPSAPAQGALAIECRSDDPDTIRLLSAIDHAPTRRAAQAERVLLAERGGGCHQRLGATQIEIESLGTLFYQRDADPAGLALPVAAPRWTPVSPLTVIATPIRAWDGSRVAPGEAEPLPDVRARLASDTAAGGALFVAHRRALPDGAESIAAAMHVWVPGIETWHALASRGIWVEGCADGLGAASLGPLLAQPLLQLPPWQDWKLLTHAEAAAGWPASQVIATYRHRPASVADVQVGPVSDVTHVYWHSGAQFDRWCGGLTADVQHACGAGRTAEHLRRAGVQNPRVFPQVALWRQWLGL
jgi:hydroxymethylbilane synthase